MTELSLGERVIGPAAPTYFIADVGANHDGDLGRAKHLVQLAAEAGADAAKFQNFAAETIVSDRGFRDLGNALSHQAGWAKPVTEVYRDASLDLDWTPALRDACIDAGIEYFTTPYSAEIADAVDPYVRLFKIGSGDVTWLELIEHVARKGKPVLLATGASTMPEVERAVEAVLAHNDRLVLMQCNTSYTGDRDNMRYVNLRVLRAYAERFPSVVLGLSDHTPGTLTVLGAVALGARVIEKHFTDDTTRPGPDHGFAMTPTAWREMVDRTRELESALGDGVKRVEDNERDTVVVQRRALRLRRDVATGEELQADDLVPLRPCPENAATPADLDRVVGRRTTRALAEGEAVTWDAVL